MFIYVWSVKERDILLAKGFELLKSKGDTFVFANNKEKRIEQYSLDDVRFVISDTLTF